MRRAEDLSGCSDEQLLNLYTRGDLEAIQVLLARYQRPLFNFVLRMVGERARAEDLLQETLLRLVEHAGTFEGGAKLKTWMFRIARNQCIDDMRRRKLRRHASLDAKPSAAEGDAQSLYERVAVNEPAPDRNSDNRELAVRMTRAIGELPEDQREVFVLRQVQHLSFKEIGEITGVGENTVKSRMRYALERLQHALAEYQDYAEEVR